MNTISSQGRPIVLFLCSGNSCRSQMAEAFLRHHAADRYEAHSAGMDPKPIHPLTVKVMAETGIDISHQRPKSLREFLGRSRANYAVFVCSRAEQACPSIHPFALERLYWPFDDPAAVEGGDEEKLAAFRRVRDQIEARIRQWLQEVE